jgi:ATP-dependent helicase/DNAse subunit B
MFESRTQQNFRNNPIFNILKKALYTADFVAYKYAVTLRNHNN